MATAMSDGAQLSGEECARQLATLPLLQSLSLPGAELALRDMLDGTRTAYHNILLPTYRLPIACGLGFICVKIAAPGVE